MLVLSRFRDESIIIDEQIVITVIEIQGSKVRIGIEAPKELIVLRSEVLKKILKENEERVRQGLPPIDPFKRVVAQEIAWQGQTDHAS